jgi:DHA3 family macrolide efflux protein-like MFS transporter
LSHQESQAFSVLWLGQLVSNLGTQASLYGMGLWLFQQGLQVVDFAAVAVVVTLARLAVLPLLGKRLATWPRRRTMLVANGIGGCVSGGLALLLLLGDGQPPLALLLALMAVSAAAEAALVMTFSSLITILVPEASAQRRAAGLFASSDGIVLTVAPFLGAAVASQAGLRGLLVVDGLSFVWACLSVLCAPWPRMALLPMDRLQSLAPVAVGFFHQMVGLLRHASLGPLARQGMAIAFVYAGCEVLFTAWLVAGMGAARLSSTLVISGVGYGFGVLIWSWRRPLEAAGVVALGSTDPIHAVDRQHLGCL